MRTQRVLKSTLDKIKDDVTAEGIRPPAVIVIGPVARLAAGNG
jgi:uroporphyrin-III C-methyltransferase/precorrin-2 dehydrogenase/sirohydrochlorin ferrochelatase